MTWIDSLYVASVTVATIGFGEAADLRHHPQGRQCTVFIAGVGIGTMRYPGNGSCALLFRWKSP